MRAAGVNAAGLSIRRLLGAVMLLALSSGAVQGQEDELLQASRDGNSTLAMALVEKGANVERTGAQGDTALHWASFYGYAPLVRLLIARGAPINAKVKNGSTPLHQAAYKGHLEIVELLVANGATVDTRNDSGLTATELAYRNEHVAVVRYLSAHGGRIDTAGISADDLNLSKWFAGNHTPQPSATRAVPARASVARVRSSREIRGLSTSLGELPPLDPRLPAAPATTGPPLTLTHDLGLQPPSAVLRASTPVLPSRGSTDDAVWVQLGSFRTRASAEKAWRSTSGVHQDLVSDLYPTIAAIEASGVGTLHRLSFGPLPIVDANRVCRALKARKTDCLIIARPDQ